MSAQADRLVELGVPELGGITAGRLREHAAALEDAALEDAVLDGAARAAAPGPGRPVLAVHPSFVSTARLATLLRRGGRAGFVVVDMSDLAEFTPTDDVRVPDAPLYLAGGVTRDDDMLGWTPTDAHAELARRGRTPLTISEGVSWLLQQPEMLEPGRRFMCIGSRKRKADGALDARTPAVAWCWANNHHPCLGFAATAGRVGRDSAQSPATET